MFSRHSSTNASLALLHIFGSSRALRHKPFFAVILAIQLLIADQCLAGVEDRINDAMPVPKSLEYAKGQLLRLATEAGVRDQVESQINAKLRVRALDCAQGYAPAPFSSKEEIAAHFGVSDCFERIDDAFATWIGWKRVGIIIKMPPIRPVPKSMPPFVIGSDYIQDIRFASNAGVVLLWTNRNLELIDLNNGRRVSRLEGLTGDVFGDVSPNGRVLPTSVPGGTSLIDVESGESLARVQSIFPRDFTWLGQDRALIHRAASMNSFTIEFDSGEEHAVRFPKEAIDEAIARNSPQNEFFALTGLSALRFRTGSGHSEEPLTLLDQKPFKIQNWQRNQGQPTADGRFYLIAAQDLNFISTDTLLTTTVAVAPFEIRTVVPQPNPDLILLIGDNPGIDQNMGMRYYIYSISRQTFAQPEAAYRNQGRIVYLANVHKLGFVSQNRITLLDSLPLEEAMSHEDFVGLMTREQEQHRAATAQEIRGPHINGTGPVRVETLPGARVTMLTSGSNWTVSTTPTDAPSDTATVEGIGIAQTSNYVTKADGSKQGVAIVHVKRGAGAPISLLLSSHDGVRWMITIERGAVIRSIMTAGPKAAEVVGMGSIPVTHITDIEANQTNTAEYQILEAQVIHATGARIHRFQGALVGTEFTVDGR
jgi:hypothetical protein